MTEKQFGFTWSTVE